MCVCRVCTFVFGVYVPRVCDVYVVVSCRLMLLDDSAFKERQMCSGIFLRNDPQRTGKVAFTVLATVCFTCFESNQWYDICTIFPSEHESADSDVVEQCLGDVY